MTSLELRNGASVAQERMAIRMRDVTKIYKLYGSRHEQIADSLGLPNMFFGARRKPAQEFYALKGVTLDIPAGQRVGIVGRNGAGKTTLLKLITQNFSPTSGDLHVDGSVQALMQMGLGFHPDFSGYENIRSALNYNGLIGQELEAALEDVIDFVELDDFLHQPMKTYSLGMQARVQFAAATAIKPDILIVDEILGAGDAYFSAKSSQRMKKLAEGDCTMLLVSHSTPQVLQFCTRAVWLEQGEVVMDGPAKEVVGAYEVFSEQRVRAQQAGTEKPKVQRTPPPPDPNAPKFSDKKWLGDAIASQDGSIGVQGDAGEAAEPENELKVKLDSGRDVFRWPGKQGVTYADVTLLNEEGQVTNVLETQRPCTFRFKIRQHVAGTVRSRIIASVFNLEALRLLWVTSPMKEFSGDAGDVHTLDMEFTPLLLGGGTYIMSVALFETDDMMKLCADDRHDLLARCVEFKVIEFDARQSPVFHHPAVWTWQTADVRAETAEVEG